MTLLTVIVPVEASAAGRATLESPDELPAGVEVLVVSYGAAAEERVLGALSPPCRVLVSESPDVGDALGVALEHASGRACLFLAAEALADRGVLLAHLQAQCEAPVVAIGRVEARGPADRHQPAGAACQGADLLALSRLENLSAPREAVQAVGGLGSGPGGAEAVWLAWRLERHGVPLAYLDGVTVRVVEKPKAIVRRLVREAAAHVSLATEHPELLPRLPLGAFSQTTLPELVFRRAALRLRLSPRLVLAVCGKRTRWLGRGERYCYWAGARRAIRDRDHWRRLTRGTAILLYHAFATPGERRGSYVVASGRFARHMQMLRTLRYPVLTLEELLQHRSAFRLPPARSVVVTFDDGYADNRIAAHPILRRHGIPATVFVVTGSVGGSNDWDPGGELSGRRLMSWADLEVLARDGIEVGAHAVSHVPLTSLPPSAMLAEAQQSRDELERALGIEVHAFAYPHGAHQAASEAAVAQAGYLGACTTEPGFNDAATPAYALRRIDIRGNASVPSFLLALWLGGANIRRRWREES